MAVFRKPGESLWTLWWMVLSTCEKLESHEKGTSPEELSWLTQWLREDLPWCRWHLLGTAKINRGPGTGNSAPIMPPSWLPCWCYRYCFLHLRISISRLHHWPKTAALQEPLKFFSSRLWLGWGTSLRDWTSTVLWASGVRQPLQDSFWLLMHQPQGLSHCWVLISLDVRQLPRLLF